MTNPKGFLGTGIRLSCRSLTTAVCLFVITFSSTSPARPVVISGDSDEETAGEVLSPVEEVESPELSEDVLDLTGPGDPDHFGGGFIALGVHICFARNRHNELFQGIARNRHHAMAEALHKCHMVSRSCVAAACTRL